MRFSLVPTALVVLAACSPNPPASLATTQVRYVHWDWPPALQSCTDDPPPLPIPSIEATDPHAGSKVAIYVERLRDHDATAQAAADDCRQTLHEGVGAWGNAGG